MEREKVRNNKKGTTLVKVKREVLHGRKYSRGLKVHCKVLKNMGGSYLLVLCYTSMLTEIEET